MTLRIRLGSFPPEAGAQFPHVHRFAKAYAQGILVGDRVRGSFPEKTLEEIAAAVTHEELVHYLARDFLHEVGTRWDFFAESKAAPVGATTTRELYLPRLDTSINLDGVARQLQSDDPEQATAAVAYLETLTQTPVEDPSAIQSFWEDYFADLTQSVEPLVEDITARAQVLCDSWVAQPPVAGFSPTDVWSKENVTALHRGGQGISDQDLTMYFLGWFLGLKVGDFTGGYSGKLGFMHSSAHASNVGLKLMYYLPEIDKITSPELFVAMRHSDHAAEGWWQLMHPDGGDPQ